MFESGPVPVPTCLACGRSFPPGTSHCPTDGTALVTREEDEDRTGSILAHRYRLTRQIGSGGMADVYEGVHVHIHKRVAVKLMKPTWAGNPLLVERFRREAVLVSMISHPNVVAIDDFGVLESGTLYMTMELLEGETLQQRLARGPLDLATLLDVAIQVGRGLAAAHEKGIVHGDVKPANVFLAPRPGGGTVAKVLDLGVARMQAASGQANVTTTEILIGSPAYMAPEQITSAPMDGRTDVYSFGIVLYELLTGRPPFSGDSPRAVLLQHLTTTPVPPALAAPPRGVPAALDALVTSALDKRPEGRPARMASLVEELEAIHRSLAGPLEVPVARSVDPPRDATAERGAQAPSVELGDPTEPDAELGGGACAAAMELAPGVFCVSARCGELLERNSYLLVREGEGRRTSVLVDPGGPLDLPAVLSHVTTILGSLDALDLVFVNHQDPDVGFNAGALQQANPRLEVVCSDHTWRLLHVLGLDPARFRSVERLWNRTLPLATGQRLQVVPTPFCHERGSVMLYDPDARVLFSGDLLGGLAVERGPFATLRSWSGIRLFHQTYMPSTDALAAAVAAIRRLRPAPRIIAPQHGLLIGEDIAEELLERLERLEVGLPFVVTRQSKENYLRVANEALAMAKVELGETPVAEALAAFAADRSFPRLFRVVGGVIVDLELEPETAVGLLAERILAAVPDARRRGFATALGSAFGRWGVSAPPSTW